MEQKPRHWDHNNIAIWGKLPQMNVYLDPTPQSANEASHQNPFFTPPPRTFSLRFYSHFAFCLGYEYKLIY